MAPHRVSPPASLTVLRMTPDRSPAAVWIRHMRASGHSAGTIELRAYHLRRLERDTRRSALELTTEDLEAWFAAHD